MKCFVTFTPNRIIKKEEIGSHREEAKLMRSSSWRVWRKGTA